MKCANKWEKNANDANDMNKNDDKKDDQKDDKKDDMYDRRWLTSTS